MHIVCITDTLELGGAEKQISLIADRLRQVGHSTMVVALAGGGGWASYLERQNIPVSILNVTLQDKIRPGTIFAFMKLVSIIRSQTPDVVVSFLYSCSIWSSLAAYLAGVPVVIAGRRDCGFQRVGGPLPRWLEKLSYLGTTRFVANSLAVSKSMQQYEGIEPDRIDIIYNGVDLPATNQQESLTLRKKHKIPDSAVVVGMLANFSPGKNHRMLIQAARRVVPHSSNVVFILAGYGDYRKQVEEEITKLCMGMHIRIVGQIENASQLLPAIDIGVLCSHAQREGFSNAVLEYMAYGKPVVATRVDGNPEVIIEGKTGYMVVPDDVDGMAEAILSLVQDPVKRTTMGYRARAYVEKEFGWDLALKRWDALFQRLQEKINHPHRRSNHPRT